MNETRDSVTWFPSGSKAMGKLLATIGEQDWATFTASSDEAEEAGSPYAVSVSLGRSSDGRLVCTGLMLGNMVPLDSWPAHPAEISARSLREIPLSDYISEALRTAAIEGEYGAAVRELLARAPSAPAVVRSRPGPRGHSDKYFQSVAALYRRAQVEQPKTPIKWLMEHLGGVSEATARRQVQRARDKGYLGSSVPGRAGERVEDE